MDVNTIKSLLHHMGADGKTELAYCTPTRELLILLLQRTDELQNEIDALKAKKKEK